MSNVTDQLFEETKNAIREILKSDFANDIKKFIFGEREYKFGEKEIADTLPNVQAINMGILKEVTVFDVDGNEIRLTADEYLNRNIEGFKNRTEKKIDLDILLEILEKIETFTAFVNFGSLKMAKDFYLEDINKKKGITEEGE